MSRFATRFPEADEAWIPTLGDILDKRSDPDAHPIYRKVGWDALEVPSDCPNVSARMDVLKVRFDERYLNRMLNAETLERWQVRLQNRFDEVVRRYDRAYSIYEAKNDSMLNDLEEGSMTTTKATSTGRSIDTPDSIINADDDYADRLNRSQADGETKVVITGTGLVRSINDTIYEWRDLDTEFVKEFEDNFLNIFWYREAIA